MQAITLDIKGQKNSTEDSLKYILAKDGTYFGLTSSQVDEVVRLLLPHSRLSNGLLVGGYSGSSVVTKQ
jgi:hypothetical protein